MWCDILEGAVKNVKEFNPNHDNKGEFSSGEGGGSEGPHKEHHKTLTDAGYKHEGRGLYRDSEGNRVKVSKSGTFTRTSKTYQMKVGKTTGDLQDALR